MATRTNKGGILCREIGIIRNVQFRDDRYLHQGGNQQAHDNYADELFKLGHKCTRTPDAALISSATKQLLHALRKLMRQHTMNTTTWKEWSDTLRGLTIDEISDKNTLYNAIATTHLRQNELDIQMANMSI